MRDWALVLAVLALALTVVLTRPGGVTASAGNRIVCNGVFVDKNGRQTAGTWDGITLVGTVGFTLTCDDK